MDTDPGKSESEADRCLVEGSDMDDKPTIGEDIGKEIGQVSYISISN